MLSNTLVPIHEDIKLQALDVAAGEVIGKYFAPFNKLDKLIDLSCDDCLDDIARMFGVEYWRIDWDPDKKRDFLAQFRKLKKHAGTRGVMQTILDIFGDKARIIEWFEEEAKGLNKGNIIISVSEDYAPNTDERIVLHGLLDIYKPAHLKYIFRVPISHNIGIGIIGIGNTKEYLMMDGSIEDIEIPVMVALLAIFIQREVLFF